MAQSEPSEAAEPHPQVTRRGLLDMQVCVPEGWSDERAGGYADAANPTGTGTPWRVRTDPDLLCGAPVRRPCAERAGCVHIMFDC